MKRSLRKILLSTLLTSIALVIITTITLVSLMRSESGTRWLLEKSLNLVPVTIEASGVSGTLADEISVESLSILLPDAEIHAKKITLSWRPSHLLNGIVDIKQADISELNILLLDGENDEADAGVNDGEETDDDLFWMDFPVHINIDSARLDTLRIDDAQFDKLNLSGSIGHRRLDIKSLAAQIEGVNLQVEGYLSGPAPGRLEATASWEMPTEDLTGSAGHSGTGVFSGSKGFNGTGSFNGDIETLAFTQIINVPEVVNFNGTIHNLFTNPQLKGQAHWARIHLQDQPNLFSDAGKLIISSDFLSARINLENKLLLKDKEFKNWPETSLKLEAYADLHGVTIDSYTLDALDGSITGSGQVDYSDGLQGQLSINGTQINTGFIDSELPGEIEFNSNLLIESASVFSLDVNTAKAHIVDRNFTGQGHALLSDGELTAIKGNLGAGSNKLTADIKFGKQLAGSINVKAPDLEKLWPGLQGALTAAISLSGSLEHPQADLAAEASAIKLDTHSLETLTLNGELQSDDRLTGKLVATGLVSGEQKLGKLDYAISGTLAEHQSTLNLNGDLVNVKLRAHGSWQDKYLTQSFEYGQVQPDGLSSWQLTKNPTLKLSSIGGTVSAHCWIQQQSSICVDASYWGSDGNSTNDSNVAGSNTASSKTNSSNSANNNTNSLHSKVVIDNFALATLQPALPEGYNIDGTINADITLTRDEKTQRKTSTKENYQNGLQGELHWRQSRTVLTYTDDIETFETVLDEIKIDLLSDETQTNLEAILTGEHGLSMTASGRVNGPLLPETPIQATAKGRLPDIALLRPLLQQVSNPGEVKGELTLDLSIAGTLGDPKFTGGAKILDGELQLLGAGITLSDIQITAQSAGTDKLLLTGQLRSGKGLAKITGEIHAAEEQGFLADILIKGKNLASVRTPNLSLDSSPDLRLRITKDIFDISGKIIIPNATAQIRDLPKGATKRSEDVIVHKPDEHDNKQAETIVTGDIEVELGDEVWFNGFGLNSRLDGKLKLTQERGGSLRSNGTVRVRDGFFTGYGKELRVDRGELTFTGALDDPLINIQVSRESTYEGRQYIIGLRLTGSAQNVKTEPFSRPGMSENDVLMFLVLDRPPSADDDASGATLAFGLQQLVPLEGGKFGLDEVSFETNDANEAAMVAGKRINDKLYVRYVFGTAGEAGAFKIRYRLGRGFSLESSTGSQQSLDIIYLLER